jgi:hypothetical protein
MREEQRLGMLENSMEAMFGCKEEAIRKWGNVTE